jgi:hypothetical protein
MARCRTGDIVLDTVTGMSQIADALPRCATPHLGRELPMTPADFTGRIAEITVPIAGLPVAAAPAAHRNGDGPADGRRRPRARAVPAAAWRDRIHP